MEKTAEGWVINLPSFTIPNSLTAENVPWVVAAAVILLVILLRFKIWRGWRRRMNFFRRTEKPLLKAIGWLSVLVSPLWLALIALVFFSIWKLATSFDDAIGIDMGKNESTFAVSG
mgnify:CR=1 FL=1